MEGKIMVIIPFFPKSISLKFDVMVWVEFDLADEDIAVLHVTRYATDIPKMLQRS